MQTNRSASPFNVSGNTSGRRATAIESQQDVSATLARLDGISNLLDQAVRIPGTNVRVGLDALIGLVPVFGDLLTKAVSGYIILEARRLGVSRWTIARMATNTTVDAVVGMVPIVGDVFDVMYRANRKNIALLKRDLERRGAGSQRRQTIDGTAYFVG